MTNKRQKCKNARECRMSCRFRDGKTSSPRCYEPADDPPTPIDLVAIRRAVAEKQVGIVTSLVVEKLCDEIDLLRNRSAIASGILQAASEQRDDLLNQRDAQIGEIDALKRERNELHAKLILEEGDHQRRREMLRDCHEECDELHAKLTTAKRLFWPDDDPDAEDLIPDGDRVKAEITLEEVEQFMSLLTGEYLPDRWTLDNVPKITRREAFTVVYYLQECLGVLPDHYEQCNICGEMYDTERGGFTIDTTGEPHNWHNEIGVTKKMIAESGGGMVCSCECEVGFWREKFPEWRRS